MLHFALTRTRAFSSATLPPMSASRARQRRQQQRSQQQSPSTASNRVSLRSRRHPVLRAGFTPSCTLLSSAPTRSDSVAARTGTARGPFRAPAAGDDANSAFRSPSSAAARRHRANERDHLSAQSSRRGSSSHLRGSTVRPRHAFAPMKQRRVVARAGGRPAAANRKKRNENATIPTDCRVAQGIRAMCCLSAQARRMHIASLRKNERATKTKKTLVRQIDDSTTTNNTVSFFFARTIDRENVSPPIITARVFRHGWVRPY